MKKYKIVLLKYKMYDYKAIHHFASLQTVRCNLIPFNYLNDFKLSALYKQKTVRKCS